MAKYLQIYRIVSKTFGVRFRPLGTFGLIQLRHLLSAISRGTDHLLHPGFKKVAIDRPVFIIGNPRSGTTFVHRFLLNTEQLAAFSLWEMLFPAITGRKTLGRIIDRLAPLSPARYHSSDAHETSLRDVETDDLLELFHFLDGGFAWSYFFAWNDVWGSDKSKRYFEPKEEKPSKTKALLKYLEGCWKRNMYFKNSSRFIAKSSQLTLRIPQLIERYPDCKLIYIVRDPLQTIPSGMSLLEGALDRSYGGLERAPIKKRSQYLENLYQASCQLYRGFEETKSNGGISPNNLRIVPYPQLMNDLEGTMEDLNDFLELEPSGAFFDKVRAQAKKQRSHKSKHKYSLERFGLNEERIRRDLDFVYHNYDVELRSGK
ncbi:MAG: sulfotransferase [Proteobacteria bacterium]|nr:sulfotransferase [Pseudomonadota bacterium]